MHESHCQPQEVSEELVQTVTYTGVVGRRFSYVGSFLSLHSAGHTDIQFRYLGHKNMHWEDAGGFPTHVCTEDIGKKP